MKSKNKDIKKMIELKISKKDLDNFVSYLDSDNFRNYGFGHIELVDGTLILITCDELVKNREEYEKSLINLGLKYTELVEHLHYMDNIYAKKRKMNGGKNDEE